MDPGVKPWTTMGVNIALEHRHEVISREVELGVEDCDQYVGQRRVHPTSLSGLQSPLCTFE